MTQLTVADVAGTIIAHDGTPLAGNVYCDATRETDNSVKDPYCCCCHTELEASRHASHRPV